MKTAAAKKRPKPVRRPPMGDGTIVLSARGMKKLLADLRKPAKPTQALRDLMAGRFDLVPECPLL